MNATNSLQRCTECNALKPGSEFPRRAKRCKLCRLPEGESFTYVNTARKRPRRTKEEIARDQLAYYRRRKYGVTTADIDRMKLEQDSRCCICAKTLPDSFAVDHCHTTGKVRGLLCRTCNSGIGLMKDDPTIVQRAADYLKRHAA